MAEHNKYDIFISYRRSDAGDKAEHLKDLLESKFKGRISFDRENLTGLFDVALIERIDNCKDFILVLGKKSLLYKQGVNEMDYDISGSDDFSSEQAELYQYLSTCTQEEFAKKIEDMGANAPLDFVRIEIGRALQRKDLHIIPVVPESTEKFAFNQLLLPPDIAGVLRYEAVFYSDNPDALFKDVVPKIEKHLQSKRDSYHLRKLLIIVFFFLLIVGCTIVGWEFIQKQKIERARHELMTSEIKDFVIEWDSDISLSQLQAIHEILDKMVQIEGGAFLMGSDSLYEYVEECLETPQIEMKVPLYYMGRYEVTISQWCGVMEIPYSEAEANLPMVNISLDECMEFCNILYNLTHLDFEIPTEAEWEYAARGGKNQSTTKYSGSNNPDAVAWYEKNSHGKAQNCDARVTDKDCNEAEIYDMSGNVSEWCLWTDSIYRLYCDMVTKHRTGTDCIYNDGVSVIRGGNFRSDIDELTVFHRETSKRTQKSDNIGLRLIIKTEN